MTRGKRDSADTATQILDVAEQLVQVRGFNAVSYADVAAELKVTTAALHYHFAGKAELGEALIARYTSRFAEALASVESRVVDAFERLVAYAGLYLDVLQKKRMCLCGMLAAEYQTLPSAHAGHGGSLLRRERGVAGPRSRRGTRARNAPIDESPSDVARMIVSSLEGAMLVARSFGDAKRFQGVADQVLAGLKPTTHRPGRTSDRSKASAKAALSGST